jgi:transposase
MFRVQSSKFRVPVPSWNRLTPDMQTNRAIKPAIRYSEAFKLQVVNEVESQGVTAESVRRKYGIRGSGTVNGWVRKYSNGNRGKIIRVETPEQIDELKRLKERVKRLEALLADANIDLAIERAYTQIACEGAGIKDVAEFKKKHPGVQRT